MIISFIEELPDHPWHRRTGFMLAEQLSWLMAPVGFCLAAGLTSCGFLLQTHGLKMGNTVPVCVCTTAAAMVSGTSGPELTKIGKDVLLLLFLHCIQYGVCACAASWLCAWLIFHLLKAQPKIQVPA